MKAQVLAAVAAFLSTGSILHAQCTTHDIKCITTMLNSFPTLLTLESQLQANLVTKRSLVPGGDHRAALTDPDVGSGPAWKSGLWDNLT